MKTKKQKQDKPVSRTSWTYRSRAFELDMNDLDTLARYDSAVEAMKSAFAECPPGATDARHLIAYCEGIRRMLDALFGDGTADALLGGTRKPTDFDAVYDSLTDFVHEQTAANAERRAQILNKYKPKQNREQRRAIEQAAQKIVRNIGAGV